MKLSRLWQPRRGLFWVMVAFNLLSSLAAWALRALPLTGPAFALVAVPALLKCGFGLVVAWGLIRDRPAA